MPAITINGIAVDVLDGTARQSVETIGEQGRAFDGTLRRSTRATKRGLTFDVPLLAPADAEPIRQLVLGSGHVWSFEGQHLYSSRGKAPSASMGTLAYGAGKFGTYALQTSDTAGVKYAIGSSAWTVIAWLYDGTSWDHYIACSDGTGGLNGVAGVAETNPDHGFDIASGEVQIGAYTSPDALTFRTDDLVILPFVIPPAWVASLYAAGAAWGDLPKLAVSGDLLSGIGALSMLGELGDTSYSQGYVGGDWYSNLQTVSVALSEV